MHLFVNYVLVNSISRLLVEDLTTARTIWLPHHLGRSMELRRVGLIQSNLDTERNGITNQVANCELGLSMGAKEGSFDPSLSAHIRMTT